MKRYIKAKVDLGSTLREYLDKYRSSYDEISLRIDGKLLVIHGKYDKGDCMYCKDLKYYLDTNTALSKFSDYPVVDAIAEYGIYTLYLVSPI